MAELIPTPLAALALRMFRELELTDSIFDLPAKKFFGGEEDLDLSATFHAHRVGTPLGPAAGPHTQMAQNIVLSWLGGARVMELKTVQILDELEIPRPCIDMQTVGFNAEWSQELKLQQSLEEYVKASMLVEMLRASGRVPETPGFAPLVYDMSVGYDLAGIQSPPVRAFLDGMRDASALVERFRRELPRELGELRDLDFATRLSDTLTLSTFHGCPPDEIERIIEHLLEDHGLHCVVKFNPTLLGPERTCELLVERLGYDHLRVPDSAFEKDTKWEQAVEMMERLGAKADGLGLGLGAKFSNTLILETHRGFIPEDVGEVYLSGAPLHVLAMTLVRRFRRRFGDRFPISFAAGIDRGNFADAVSLGLVPITVCSDLLQPGGYGRLSSYQRDLVGRMRKAGAASTGEWILRSHGLGAAALDDLATGADAPDLETLAACRAALEPGGDSRAAAGDDLWRRWISATKLLNTEQVVAATLEDPRYALARNSKVPRKIGSHLELFDCITCDKCVPVCPNDANFTFRPPVDSIPVVRLVRDGDAWQRVDGDPIPLAQKHQIANFADSCNDCGNCDVFCPEDGGPYVIKPRFFGSPAAFAEFAHLDGFYLESAGGRDLGLSRSNGREVRFERRSTEVRYSGEGFELRFDAADPAGTATGEGPDEIDLTPYFLLDAVFAGIFASDRMNPVRAISAALDAPGP